MTISPRPPARAWHEQDSNAVFTALAAAAMTATLGHRVDTSVIVSVVIINALIGFIQESKAEEALNVIRNLFSQQATVRRDRQALRIAALAIDESVLTANQCRWKRTPMRWSKTP